MTRWEIKQGEILDQQAHGLLCSANPSLNLSGGVGGAFAMRYGTEMQTYLHDHLKSNSLQFLQPGQAVVAPPFGSPYRAVAHAVAIDAFYDTDIETLVRAYNNALQGLAAENCKSIAASCLGCGYGRVTETTFAAVVQRIRELSFPAVEEIVLVTRDSVLVEHVSSILSSGGS